MGTLKKLALPGAVMAATFMGVTGASIVSGLQANAATPAAASTSTQAAADTDTGSTAPKDESVATHVGSNGVKEVLLTGDTAAKAQAAALAAVPGGTIQRVENDAEGATYEAHMTKSDGSRVTVKMDANFNVTATEAGGPSPH